MNDLTLLFVCRRLPNVSSYYADFPQEFSPGFFADFDGDNFVGSTDIEHAVKLLTQNELAMDEIESIWEKVRSGEIDSIEVTRGRKDLQMPAIRRATFL